MFSSKKEDPFFAALYQIAENLNAASHYADDFRITSIADLKELSVTLKKYETDGDKLIHQLIQMLNKSFMTPIEREDILELAVRMDDILDGIEGCIAHFEMFSLTEVDDYMRDFLKYITLSTDEIVAAMKHLLNRKLLNMREHAIVIKDYERKCDEVLRTSIKQLFSHEKDPIRITQFKDIYEQLEEVADYCQNVANAMDTIIMRNA
ncbi:MAG: DUF47 domain-containing protein [Kurthia gibsonii]|uniref:DUF47 family protein n=1 Tax=Kurthia gibsonii TaxID=33946 RepID=A0ABU9LNF2_9BACL|nr:MULTISPECIES: DUF47 family protein [Kurthia]MCA9723854.1 DUF47 domain-containing protein [Kurthia sp.]AMA64544.1 hypothetical protein ASO14_232 [Kurthia sp. 11kri321]MEB6113609.1 DUF47 family protein [Kurthia gibsonii]MEB7772875.1 DUF47 family protein [Kurthia gibsonii]RXH52035.1 DUF47 domain-containing protein [Kurthia gibsonii]